MKSGKIQTLFTTVYFFLMAYLKRYATHNHPIHEPILQEETIFENHPNG